MSEITKRKKGQMLNNTERQLIMNLMNYLKNKYSEKSVSEIIREISKATGCSERTIYKIKKEASKGITVVVNRTRLRKKENKNSRNVKYDSFVKSSIRKKIHSYFLQNSSPTLNTILFLVNSDPVLPNFKRSTLHTFLKEIGFVYEQKGKKSLLTESRDLVELRQAYLRDIRQFRRENRCIVYTGENVLSLMKKEVKKKGFNGIGNISEQQKCQFSLGECETVSAVYINTSEPVSEATLVYTIDADSLENVVMAENLHLRDGISMIQQISSNSDNIPIHRVISVADAGEEQSKGLKEETTTASGHDKESSRELRLTVMHAGSDQGFLQGADFITLSKKKGEDLENYKQWFLKKLLPKVPHNSVVVTDINAPSNKLGENFPDSSWKKLQIKNWLLSKNMKVEHLNQKKELLAAVNQVRPIHSISYKIHEAAKAKGIVILSLPPFHYELNPLNLVWAHVKYYVRSNIESFKVKKIKHIIKEGFYSISQFNWTNDFHHVREVEDLLWTIDQHQERQINFNTIQPNILEEDAVICENVNNL